MTPLAPPASPMRLPPIVRPEDRGGVGRYRMAVLIGLFGVSAYLLLVTRVMVQSSYDTWAAYFIAPVLFALSAPLLRRMLSRVEPDPWIRQAVVVGLVAKLLFGFVRFYVNEFALGHGDARNYAYIGSLLATEFRSFTFGGPAFQLYITDYHGTRFIRLLTGIIYVVTGATQLGGYVVFSFISFWGLYFFYRAYSIAMPDGLRRRYVMLVFFLPSVVFWPSSIGKEAWMTTMLGFGAYGVARLLTHQRFGYLCILSAMAGMATVRPHVAAIFFAGLGAAFVLRNSKGGGGTTKKVLGLLVLALVAGVLLSQLQSFFDQQDGLDAQQVFNETSRRSGQGGAQFETAQPTSVAGLPWAVITVLFRPFLFEAGNLAGLVTALEGTVLLALFLWNLPRLIRLPGLMVARPYVGFAVVYTLIFTFAFSAISNFGILARQRTQLFPIAVIVLTVPIETTLRTRRDLELRPVERAVGDRPSIPEPAGPGPQIGHRPLPYLTVGAHNRNEGAQAEGGQLQRGPPPAQEPAWVSHHLRPRAETAAAP
jgi:hypothetical protein